MLDGFFFSIKRAWAVLAILRHSASGYFVSGQGFWAPTVVLHGLDMMLLGMTVYSVWQVQRERESFYLVCVYCARVLCRDLVDTPRDCKLQQDKVVWHWYTSVLFSERF